MPLNLDLTGRAALVTGGSRGIGEAICLRLAQAGASVAVAAGRDAARAEAVAEQVRKAGAGATTVVGDVADPATAARYVEAAVNAFGRLDILVNNAGIWEEAAVEDAAPEFVRRTLAINLEAAFATCREAAPHLKRSPSGRIVNISSTASLLGEPLHAAYAASKGGLDALTRSLAVELGPARITVNSVAPGWTATEMAEEVLQSEAGRALIASIPLRKVATAGDVAYAVVYLCSDWAGHVSGITLPVEGAYRLRR